MGDEDVYATIDIGEMEFDAGEQAYTYDCPCGDKFRAPLDELKAQYGAEPGKGYFIATCPACGLQIKVNFDGGVL